MMRRGVVGAAALVAALFSAGYSAAEPVDKPAAPKKKELAPQPSVSSLEISGVFGPTYTFGDAANPEYVQSVHQAGAYGELAVAYRSSYFVDPFISVGYGTLASGADVTFTTIDAVLRGDLFYFIMR